MSARRWLSLASPDKNGDDDLFSSDLGEDRLRETFGRIPRETALLVIFGEEDEYVPEFVDKEGLVKRWVRAVEEGGGGAVVSGDSTRLLEGASHNLNGNPEWVVDELCRRVVRFVEELEKGKGGDEASL